MRGYLYKKINLVRLIRYTGICFLFWLLKREDFIHLTTSSKVSDATLLQLVEFT
jgi:hypothetical protein